MFVNAGWKLSNYRSENEVHEKYSLTSRKSPMVKFIRKLFHILLGKKCSLKYLLTKINPIF
jgi:hypothetical protein